MIYWNITLLCCFSYIYMTDDICTGDPHLIREARVSFPSGHSSFTVFSMVFVIVSKYHQMILIISFLVNLKFDFLDIHWSQI